MISIGHIIKCFGAGLMLASAVAFRNLFRPFEYCLFWLLVGAFIAFYGLALEDSDKKTTRGAWMNPDSNYWKKASGFRYYAKWRLLVMMAPFLGFIVWVVLPVVLPSLQNYARIVVPAGGP